MIVLTTALVDMDHYHDPSIQGCRLTPRYPAVYYGTFIGPACLILLINTVVFFMVLKVTQNSIKPIRNINSIYFF